MNLDRRRLDLLASCLEYPVARTAALAREAAGDLAPDESELAAALAELAAFLERCAPGEAEERYTALFDMSPVCTLNTGYHVFGDTYPRGELLAGLASELQAASIPTRGDLPDYLPTLLRLLGELTPDDACLLRQMVLGPALRRMRELLVDSKDPWSRLLRALPAVVAIDAEAAEAPPPPPAEVRRALSQR